MIDYLAEMQRFLMAEARAYDSDRITYIQLYVVAMAAMTAFFAGQTRTTTTLWSYRFLAIFATSLMFVVQAYWYQYARESTLKSQEYLTELTQSYEKIADDTVDDKEVLHALARSECVDLDGKPVLLKKKDARTGKTETVAQTVSWRVRKDNEVRDNWLGWSRHKHDIPNCFYLGTRWDAFLTWRLLNIWSIAIVLFGLAACILAPRMMRDS